MATWIGAEDVWLRIDEGSAVGGARRRAAAMATATGLGEERVSEVEIVVSELATNLVRHAGGGDLVLRSSGEGPRSQLRVLAIDSGPGSRNIGALISDGVSTRGSLGIGLGACVRLSSTFDAYSVPALGTVVQATFGHSPDPDPVDFITRPLPGQTVCGDTVARRRLPGGELVALADGLGHGPLAAEAARRAAEVLVQSESTSPAVLLERMSRALAATRGAAVAVVRLDDASGTLVHAGVGNIAARLVGDATSKTLPSQPGIVGHKMPRTVREQRLPVAGTSAAVLHSDGLSDKWSADDLSGAFGRQPGVLAAALLRGAGTRRDDASVLVLRTAA